MLPLQRASPGAVPLALCALLQDMGTQVPVLVCNASLVSHPRPLAKKHLAAVR